MKNNSYKRILVAVDFSENSEIAINKALQIARLSDAELHLVHFVEVPIYPVLEDIAVMGIPGLWDESITKDMLEASSKKLSQLATKFKISQFESMAGIAENDIVDYAERKKCDLVVMGAHGLSGIKRLIGSTTNAVINHANCDVLAVRIHSEK
ncbi:universal stress protein [Thiomicrorhabdus sp. Kp2]|uniref:universal stress protein n=1 Tax=Thiomicrorhabdus sp. Kp2 TaxID=1123518 RepID=UPI000409F49B|nr:universal stress protein [Thiomicrorhabdus sp. Kp2]